MNVFEKELSLLEDSDVLSLTESLMAHFPAPFWRMPASSTGKYHPESSAGFGGLVTHTRQVFWIAKTIIDTGLYNVNRDVVLAACLLHDGWKYGENSRWTIKNHAALAVQKIQRIVDSSHFFVTGQPVWYHLLLDCILSHNNRFTNK